jgi:hypothetical protein
MTSGDGDKGVLPTTPAKIPAAPTPLMARPTIRAVELGAAPLRAEDASKTRILHRRVHLTEKSV